MSESAAKTLEAQPKSMSPRLFAFDSQGVGDGESRTIRMPYKLWFN